MEEALSPEAYRYGLRTPSPKRSTPRRGQCEYSDRLVPNRAASDLGNGLDLLTCLDGENSRPPNSGAGASGNEGPPSGDDENNSAYARLLRLELLGLGTPPPKVSKKEKPPEEDACPRTPERRSLFRYRASPEEDPASPLTLRSCAGDGADEAPPLGRGRKVAPDPFKVLSAPSLEDDFYMNTLDCSGEDVVAVGMGGCVDFWNVRSNRANRLFESAGGTAAPAAVSWSPDSTCLAVGTKQGEVQIWDAARGRKLRSLSGHCRRVGTLSWSSTCSLTSGGQDHGILHHDLRQPAPFAARLRGHSQEVCGLKWSPDQQQLASGGNEGNVFVWSLRSAAPEHRFAEHEAAVKALAWSPHQRGLLLSGGGTADKCLRFWNTLRGTPVSSLCSGAQVCGALWSRTSDEIVTTHGYSGNEVVVWRYPSMTRVATLTGHCSRVIYLAAMSDGQSIVTGAGDQTLRFWSVFRPPVPRPGAGGPISKGAVSSLSRTIR